MTLMASVSGIRGIVGETMTPQLAASAGCALATFIGGGRVVVGRDSRPSGDMVRSAVVSGLLAGGCNVVDLGIVTTPSAALMVTQLRADAGVVLTASHNPAQWNGIKFLSRAGAALPAAEARRLLDLFGGGRFQLAPVGRIGSLTADDSTNRRHVGAVLKLVNVEAIRSRRFRVVLDSVNGAGGPAGRMLLDQLACDVVHINGEPTGQFAHTPEPIAENLTSLCTTTAAQRADLGFAQDPDADRLAIVDEQGCYVGEEYTLALAVRHMFAHLPGPCAANLSTSRMIDDLATRFGEPCVVHRSAVGEANVVEAMVQQRCVIGGEGNGGVIDPRVVYVRDSLTAMALILQLLADEGRRVSAMIAELPRYEMVKDKFICDAARIGRALDAVRTRFAGTPMSTLDGVRINWPDGWVHVRGSNTEPIMRVIAEARDRYAAQALVARVREVVDAVV